MIELKGFVKDWKPGDVITVDYFHDDTWLDVSGISKGKGFQGVVKRYNFAGVNDATHGQHNRMRAPGSLGASSYPSRVFKGMRMARTDRKQEGEDSEPEGDEDRSREQSADSERFCSRIKWFIFNY